MLDAVFLDFQRLTGTTWFYLSGLLALAVFFKFTRFFCLRNLDLVALFALVPGLLAVTKVDKGMLAVLGQARELRPAGPLPFDPAALRSLRLWYGVLLAVTLYWVGRALVDLFLVRRPRLDPNLEVSGMACLGLSLLGFLVFEAMTKEPDPAGRASAAVAAALVKGDDAPAAHLAGTQVTPPGTRPAPAHPGTTVFTVPVQFAVENLLQRVERTAPPPASDLAVGVARSAAILSHLIILAALVVTGWRHFHNPPAGVGMATLYLMLPLTAINIEKIDQVLPAAGLAAAVALFPLPAAAGAVFGAISVFFFPLFLLPLWMGFYGRDGAGRFLAGFLASAALLWGLVLWLDPLRGFLDTWASSFRWSVGERVTSPLSLGFWTETTQFYRWPLFVVYMAAALAAGFWPPRKNLAELIALSALLTLGIQFWFPDRGGTYVHWYLPLVLLMVFRPNLLGVRPPQALEAPRRVPWRAGRVAAG